MTTHILVDDQGLQVSKGLFKSVDFANFPLPCTSQKMRGAFSEPIPAPHPLISKKGFFFLGGGGGGRSSFIIFHHFTYREMTAKLKVTRPL